MHGDSFDDIKGRTTANLSQLVLGSPPNGVIPDRVQVVMSGIRKAELPYGGSV